MKIRITSIKLNQDHNELAYALIPFCSSIIEEGHCTFVVEPMFTLEHIYEQIGIGFGLVMDIIP